MPLVYLGAITLAQSLSRRVWRQRLVTWLEDRERRHEVLCAADSALAASFTPSVAEEWIDVSDQWPGNDVSETSSVTSAMALAYAQQLRTGSPRCAIDLDATTAVSESLPASIAPSITPSMYDFDPRAGGSTPLAPSATPPGSGRGTPSWLLEAEATRFQPLVGGNLVGGSLSREAQARDPTTMLKPRAPSAVDLANGPDENSSERDVRCQDSSAMLKLADLLRGSDDYPLRLKIDGHQPLCFAVADTNVQSSDMSIVELLEQEYRKEHGYAVDASGEAGDPRTFLNWLN